MVILAIACTPPPSPVEAIHFVRGGIIRGGVVENRAWTPGEAVYGVTAPSTPECVPLFHVELEDMRRLAAMNAPSPGAALAFSPDGRWLAIGSDGGSLRIVDATTGKERVTTAIAEGAVKQVAWSADGATLYMGEQSPDATIAALDSTTLSPRWQVHLASELEASALPPADDVLGLYSLPAVFGLSVLDDGSLLVTGAHGWPQPDGTRKNRSRLYRIAADGARMGAWPAAGPADGIMLHPAVSGRRAAVMMSRSATGPAPADLPIGGLVVIDLDTMLPRWQTRFPILTPYFTEVFAWDAIATEPGTTLAGMGDGRVFLYDDDGIALATLTPGVPVLSQGVPIAAGVGFGTLRGGVAYFATTETNIPFGSADPAMRPPSAHPAQFTLHAVDRAGAPRWSRPLDHHPAGVAMSPDGTTLLVGAGSRMTDTRTDLFGAVLLDASSGSPVTACSTEGPAHFRPVWAPDGREIAVAEAPFTVEDAVHGSFRVTVFR